MSTHLVERMWSPTGRHAHRHAMQPGWHTVGPMSATAAEIEALTCRLNGDKARVVPVDGSGSVVRLHRDDPSRMMPAESLPGQVPLFGVRA